MQSLQWIARPDLPLASDSEGGQETTTAAATAAAVQLPALSSEGYRFFSQMDVRFSITVRQHQSLHNLIEAIPEEDWTPILCWMDGAADVAETTYTPFQSEPDAAPVRLIISASPSAGG